MMPSSSKRKRESEEANRDRSIKLPDENTAIRSMFNNPTFADVAVKFSDETFYLHSSILASSSLWFSAILSAAPPLKNKEQTVIELKDDCPKALEICLRWTYTFPYPSSSNNIKLHLLAATCADKYGILPLKSTILSIIDSMLSGCHVDALTDAVLRLRFGQYCAECVTVVHRHRDARLKELFEWPRFARAIHGDLDLAGKLFLQCPEHLDARTKGVAPLLEKVVEAHDGDFAYSLLLARLSVRTVEASKGRAFAWFKELVASERGRELLRGDKRMCAGALLSFLV